MSGRRKIQKKTRKGREEKGGKQVRNGRKKHKLTKRMRKSIGLKRQELIIELYDLVKGSSQ